MNSRNINALIPFFIFLFCLPSAAQVTKVSKDADIFVKPGGEAIGELNEGAKITKLGKDKTGKYGRLLAVILVKVDGKEINLNELLVKEGLAVEYMKKEE